MNEFILDPKLAADCVVLGDFPLCRLLLMNDANYPWFILVPRRPGVTEIHELSEPDRQQLMRESSLLSAFLARAWSADKMNVAALGNQVAQLHVHHIVRFHGDPAWPAPVWGRVPPKPYDAPGLARVTGRLTDLKAAGLVRGQESER
ncbi:MAG: HIT domain-containing protein [Gammaproteobacteria bacterium]|jgi:diadenosine tetraphosphate (Ap4A) HIT family hydrolase